ncbi:MAG TPA: polyprenol monophosphomannose synthase [Actinomycetota bacterium]|nr:polyprenol monophosphomannose synthase [Actinomycetota bacterium]
MKVCVVIPTYNESGTISEVVSRVLASTPDVDVLVVDDNSPDGTGKIADAYALREQRVRTIHRQRKEGLGPAYIAGFRDALARGYDAVIEMDADLSHPPEDVPRLIETAATADVVIGSRYAAGGSTRNWSKNRERLSRAGNTYARLALGVPVHDATAGFRIYRASVLSDLPLDEVSSAGYGFQIEMLWRAWLAGFKVVEIPIVFTERREGVSKMSRAIVLEALKNIAVWSMKRARPTGTPHPRSVVAAGR